MKAEMTDVAARALPNKLLKVDDLAQLLQIDPRTVARLCKQGLLPPPLKIGGGNRWRDRDVAEALEQLARASRPKPIRTQCRDLTDN